MNFKVSRGKVGLLNRFSLTTQLIFFNVLIYFVLLILSAIYSREKIFSLLAITPDFILSGKYFWTFLSSMFVHASFFHLFANMFSLFFIGKFLEPIIGRKRYFWVYLISGIIGSLFYVAAAIIFGGTSIPAVGASGAIFGLLGILAVLVPFSRIYLVAGPLILIILQVVLEKVLPSGIFNIVSIIITVLMILMIISLFSFNSPFRKLSIPVELPMWALPIFAIVPLSIIGFFVDLPIGNSAHFGGLVIGLIYGFYLRKKFPNKTKRISNFFRGR